MLEVPGGEMGRMAREMGRMEKEGREREGRARRERDGGEERQ